MKKIIYTQNLHLSISAIIVIPIALVYGSLPNQNSVNPFDFTAILTDLANILKAIMGLYIAFALFWVYAIFNNKFWASATISNILFMSGLGFGRVVSSIIDGLPSPIFILGTFGELLLAFYGIFLLSKNKNAIN